MDFEDLQFDLFMTEADCLPFLPRKHEHFDVLFKNVTKVQFQEKTCGVSSHSRGPHSFRPVFSAGRTLILETFRIRDLSGHGAGVKSILVALRTDQPTTMLLA